MVRTTEFMALPENPREVADGLVAALSDGRRTPQEVLSGLHEVQSWDLERLEALVHELREASHSGRLSDHDFGTLRLMLSGWLRPTPDFDPEATDELEVHMPAEAEAPRAAPQAPSTAAKASCAPAAAPPADLTDSPLDLRQGLLLRDRYLLSEPIARGGQSLIYRARDLRREASAGEAPDVAVKVLREEVRASAPAIARLRREFRQTQALRHTGIVRMYDLDCDRDAWFISMELLEGTSLANRLKKAAAAPFERIEAMRIAMACADVLTYAHRLGIPHGDFKPGNVFLEDRGGIKLLDFGAAADSIGASNQPAVGGASITPIVTRAYASPEVLAGQLAEPRDDLYSFACVVYEMLSGRHPFNRLPAHAARDASLVPQPLSQLSGAQNAALASALAWTRADRPPTVSDLMLSLLDEGSTIAIRPAAPPAVSSPRKGSLPWRWIAGLVAASVLIIVLRLRAVEEHAADVAPVAQELVNSEAAPAARATEPANDNTAPKAAVITVPAELPKKAVPSQVAPTPKAAPRTLARVGADSAVIPVSESASVAVILLHRRGDLDSPVQVAWRIASGSARPKEDFDGPLTGTTRFLAGQATRAIYVPLINDSTREGSKVFTLTLLPRSAAVGPISKVTITILDDD